MSSTTRRLALSLAPICLSLGVLGACSSGSSDSTVAVTGTDDSCDIAGTELTAGKIGFEFTNKASDINELYVLAENGDVRSEVENVTTGTSRNLTVNLVAGEYQVLCKPGQTGDGFSSDFSVTGAGGAAQAEPDRTVSFDSVDFTYAKLDLTDVKAEETIRFEMHNSGGQPHEFEVLDPAGEAIGEVAAVAAGDSGGATITFTEPGTYTFQCILVDPDTDMKHTELGMTGKFEVTAA